MRRKGNYLNRGGSGTGLDSPADLETIHAGHGQVQDDEARLDGSGYFACGVGIIGLEYLQIRELRLDLLGQEEGKRLLIVHQQDAHRAGFLQFRRDGELLAAEELAELFPGYPSVSAGGFAGWQLARVNPFGHRRDGYPKHPSDLDRRERFVLPMAAQGSSLSLRATRTMQIPTADQPPSGSKVVSLRTVPNSAAHIYITIHRGQMTE